MEKDWTDLKSLSGDDLADLLDIMHDSNKLAECVANNDPRAFIGFDSVKKHELMNMNFTLHSLKEE